MMDQASHRSTQECLKTFPSFCLHHKVLSIAAILSLPTIVILCPVSISKTEGL